MALMSHLERHTRILVCHATLAVIAHTRYNVCTVYIVGATFVVARRGFTHPSKR